MLQIKCLSKYPYFQKPPPPLPWKIPGYAPELLDVFKDPDYTPAVLCILNIYLFNSPSLCMYLFAIGMRKVKCRFSSLIDVKISLFKKKSLKFF